jgi:cation:H+ antiporter
MSLFYIFIGFFLLVIGGEFITRASVSISLKFKLPKLIIGMTVMAFATSLPELIVSINAALKGSPSIALNNIIGSNIANIGLVLSVISISTLIVVEKSFYKKDWPIMFIFTMMLFVFSLDSIISQLDGLVMFTCLLVFIYYFISRKQQKNLENEVDEKLLESSGLKITLWLLISTLSLFYGAEFLVDGAVDFAKKMNVSEAVISVSVVAIGTSIPELAASLIAIIKKEKGLSIGNIIGSNIFNIGSVLGITALIKPIQVASEILSRDIPWVIAFSVLLLLLALLPKKNSIGKAKGFLMLLVYIYFILNTFS